MLGRTNWAPATSLGGSPVINCHDADVDGAAFLIVRTIMPGKYQPSHLPLTKQNKRKKDR